MRVRLVPIALALCASLPASQTTYHRVRVGELELVEGTLPASRAERPWEIHWSEMPARLPYAVVDGGEAWVRIPGFDPLVGWGQDVALEDDELCVRVESEGEVRGTLFVPTPLWDGMLRVGFRIPGGATEAGAEQAFREARTWHYDVLARRQLPGGAWFRHRLLEAGGVAGRELPPTDEVEPFALFSGGRAVSENLQLERALPTTGAEELQTIEVDAIPGITTPARDWSVELSGEPRLDPLAALVPEDQHALFFPSFDALARVFDELEATGAPLAQGVVSRAASSGTRRRVERQLALSLDLLARALGPQVVASVAVTGSDPYWKSGSDIAVLFRPADGQSEALGALLRARQELALEEDVEGLEAVDGTTAQVGWHGVVAPDRSVCSYLAPVGEAWVVTNSRAQLERIARVAAGEAPSLAASGDYRWFRQRYARGEAESAFLMLSDATIRRWCGPRWRIGAQRRVLAAARLAELQARHAAAVLGAAEPPSPETLAAEAAELGFDRGPAALGALAWHAGGVRSERYGDLSFQTPILELELGRATAEEERLYGQWREGYQHGWSNFFDPIALRVTLEEDGTALDLSVEPLILASDYGDLTELTGDARLAPHAGGHHAGTLVAGAIALDTDGKLLREVNQSLSGLMSGAGVGLLDWLGGALGMWVEPSPVLEGLAEAEDLDQALEDLWVDLESVPLVLQLDVKSPLELAAFLVALRALADETAPGAAVWETRSHGEERYVRIGSDLAGDDFALYYATPPGAFLLTVSEATLTGVLDRLAAERAAPEEVPAPSEGWLGESVALELDGAAIGILAPLLGRGLDDPLRRLAWNDLPILNEWRRLWPERDPLAVHRALWHEELVCPGGGRYVWNEAWQTMESTVYGHPGEPRRGPELPSVYRGLDELRFGLTLLDGGLRARAAWRRATDER